MNKQSRQSRGIKSSIRKWGEIRDNLCAHIKEGYDEIYWDACGYCEAFGSGDACGGCPLSEISTKYHIRYCYTDRKYSSLASDILKEASLASDGLKDELGNWDTAIEKTEALLAKMKRDLKKYEKEVSWGNLGMVC